MLESVNARYDGPALEGQVLEFWRRYNVFEQVLAAGKGREPFIFYEGPPTANGRPGIHHVLARTFKDLFPRYKTMRGFHCPRKAGWDTHGLPVEHEIEKELGIFDKKRIEAEVGISRFVGLCRASVMRYVCDWETMTERMGFWVDLKHAYFTLDNSYIESVWYVIRQIWDRGLIYQGYKVVPYDPRIGATLSSHEVAQGYREVEDPSVFVRFRVIGEADTYFLVWTTTPWTLPANVLLAVRSDVEYAWVEWGKETLILAKDLIPKVLNASGEPNSAMPVIKKQLLGSELDGTSYERPFDYLDVDGDICRVRTADFVTVEDGTGIVHIAPPYGEDDLRLGQSVGLPVVHAVGEDGCFLQVVQPVAGMFFRDANPVIINLLRARDLIFRETTHTHNYPFGWRTGDPLIYYAKHAWYIRTTELRDRMVELNRNINWVPENIRDGRFGNWLEANVDWALSRERFWGTPLPIWTDGQGDYLCISSIEELERLSARSLREIDLHRPTIDDVTFVSGGRLYRRVNEVIDCWFDSGCMPYAQWHYPFENRLSFSAGFPADFVCEAIDQTRGWFYTLHAIATMVLGQSAYRNAICLAHIVDRDGRKMSKSLGNTIDPYEVFNTVGADALRWYFSARVAPDIQKRMSVDIVADVAASFFNTLWNTYVFFVMYSRLDDVDLRTDVPVAGRPEMDRWILALLELTIVEATKALDAFDSLRAGGLIERFVDQLSNWYIRRNRRRFWKAANGADKQAAYLTLYECLTTVTRLIAPFTPFLSEALHQNLVRKVDLDAPLSVHMVDWPKERPELRDDELLSTTEVIQRVVGLGRSARNTSRVKIRQPLKRLLVRVPDDAADAAVKRHQEQILDELNVKTLEFLPRDAELVSYRLKPNLPVLGKRYGKLVPAIQRLLSEVDSRTVAAAAARGETQRFTIEGSEVELGPGDLLVETSSAEGWAGAEEGGYLVGLDTTLDDALRVEGLARELVRAVQDARKQAGVEVSDRIVLIIRGADSVGRAVDDYRDYLMSETLTSTWSEPTNPFVVRNEREPHWEIRLARCQAS